MKRLSLESDFTAQCKEHFIHSSLNCLTPAKLEEQWMCEQRIVCQSVVRFAMILTASLMKPPKVRDHFTACLLSTLDFAPS